MGSGGTGSVGAEYVTALVEGVGRRRLVEAVQDDLTALSGRSLRRGGDRGGAASVLRQPTSATPTASCVPGSTTSGPGSTPPMIVTPERLRDGGSLEGKDGWIGDAEHPVRPARQGRRPRRRATRQSLLRAGDEARPCHGGMDLVPLDDEIRRSTATGCACSRRWTPRVFPARDSPRALGRPRPAVTADPSSPHGERPWRAAAGERPLEDLLAELDALVGLDHVKAEVRRLTSLLRIQKIRAERGLPDDRDEPPPRVHRQSRHRQDDRRPAAQPDLPHVGRRLEGPPRGDGAFELVGGYVGQTATRTADCWNRRSAGWCSSTRRTRSLAVVRTTSGARRSTPS